MGYVFDFYDCGTSNLKTAMAILRDKASLAGWVIDEDKIDTDGELSLHIPNTNCYFTLSNKFVWQDPWQGTIIKTCNAFFRVDVYTGFKAGFLFTSTWLTPGNIGEINSTISNINFHLFVHQKMLILLALVYRQDRNYYNVWPVIFGQLLIPNETTFGNYIGSFFENPYDWSEGYGLYEIYPFGYKIYHNGYVFIPFGRTAPSIEDKKGIGVSVIIGRDFYGRDPAIYGETSDKRHPQLSYLPYQFGRLYLRTLPVFHKYTDPNNVTYRYIVGETPHYGCYFPGKDWHNKVITYGTRKFRVYSLADFNSAHKLGLAIEIS